jgi:hypothetical protein
MLDQSSYVVGFTLHGKQAKWVPGSYNRSRRTSFDENRTDLQERTQQEIPVTVPLCVATNGLYQGGVRGELSAYVWVCNTSFTESPNGL